MKRVGILLALVVGSVSVSQASIINTVTAAGDGDGVMICQTAPEDWHSTTSTLDITGNHTNDPDGPTGHIDVDVETDTPLDPVLRLWNTIDNDTGLPWASYTVDISLANKTSNASLGFTIGNLELNAPGTGWTASILSQPSSSNSYVGSVKFSGAPAIPAGGAIDFQYNVTFSGATKYVLTQAMTPEPVPEPSSLLLLLCGGLSLVVLRRKLARG